MKNKKNLSILVAFAMLFNLFVFPVSAGASTLDNNTVYAVEGDTKEPAVQAPEVKTQTVLDVSRGSITIANGSVTGRTPDGTAATVNPNGYEIVGSTTTNQIVVNDAVPITINNLNIDYNTNNIMGGARAINMFHGGEITVRGINTMNRVAQIDDTFLAAFIGKDSGKLRIIGDGTLNMTDGHNGVTIGGNNHKGGQIEIAGDVTINAKKLNKSATPVIGSGIDAEFIGEPMMIVITENAKVNASLHGAGSTASVIGGPHNSSLGGRNNTIAISGKADVTAMVGEVDADVSAIGSGASGDFAGISIEDGARVKLENASTATVINSTGMGLPLKAPLISSALSVSVMVSSFANIDAPGREHYYLSEVDFRTPVYKTIASGIRPNAMVDVTHSNKTVTVKAHADGTMNLYLPVGTHIATIDGVRFEGEVDKSGNSILIGANTLRAANIEKELDATKSLDLTGHAISTAQSQGAITYTITDAGTTGATLTGNTLNWTAAGTAVLKASQVAEGTHASAETTFNLVVSGSISENIRGVLDISRGSITITKNSVTAKTTSGADAAFNPNGYEIVGSTTTNTIVVNDAVPITINNLNIDYNTNNIMGDACAINMFHGGEITVRGTNTMNRVLQQSSRAAFIGHDDGVLKITGDGTLNMTDRNRGVVIGGNTYKTANLEIAGDVTINAQKQSNFNGNYADSPVIGTGWDTADPLLTAIVITENAKVNASFGDETTNLMAPIIGRSGSTNNDASITISGKAEVTATAAAKGDLDTVAIGAGTNPGGTTDITIEDGARLTLDNASTTTTGNNAGMGFPVKSPFPWHQNNTKIRVSSFANIDAPERENYYKALDGITPVYKTIASGIRPNAMVDVTHSNKTVTIKTQADGTMNLYLPVGTQSLIIDGIKFTGEVDTSGNTILIGGNTLRAANIEKELGATKSLDLTGHAISTAQSPGAITYTITDAGTTGATLTGNTLNWTAAGTAVLKASQVAEGTHDPAETTFNLVVTKPMLGVLDISKAPITITSTSVTAKTTSGADAAFNPKGYEIVGSTETNQIVVNDAVPITINGITLDYKTDTIGTGIQMVGGGEITVDGTNTLNRTLQTKNNGFIGQDAGQIILKGDGTLNITDGENSGSTIGGNQHKPGNIWIGGSVNINAIRTRSTSNGTIIGGGYNVDGNLATVVITENAKINATIDGVSQAAVIGLATKGTANITISGKAQVIATGGTGLTQTSVIGTNRVAGSIANITIEDGTSLKVVSRGEATPTEAAGMGLPKNATITSDMIARSIIKISPFANINAPASENYYKDLAGTTAVYKTTAVYTVTPDAIVDVTHGGKTVKVKAHADGTMNLYLPLGEQKVNIAGTELVGTVDTSGNTKLVIDPLLAVADLSVHASKGIQGVNLSGHATSNSSGAITYTLLNAGNTGAKLDGTVLNWNMPGTVRMNAVQEANGNYPAASTEFAVNITTNPGDVHVNVSVDVNSAGWGSIAVLNKNNEEILPFVPAGEEITLKATADKGYKLNKWVKTTTTRAITAEDLPAVTDFKITAQAGVGYMAYFKATEISPKLDVLKVSSMVIQPDGTTKEKYKPLIRQDGTEDVLFDSQKLEYGLYLRSVDTNDINIYVRHSDTKPLNIKIGNEAGIELDPFNQYKVALKLNGGAYQEIPILVDDGVDQTTYVIKVFKIQKTENDPHIYSELEINPIKEVLELGIYAMNVDVNSFAMTIKIDELLPADKKAFAAFSNKKGVEFNDLSVNLAGSLENYFNLDPRFQISDMRSDGQFISVTVAMKTTDGVVTNSVKFGDKPEKIISINVKRNKAYKGNIINEIDTLTIQSVIKASSTYGNNLSSKFYGDLNDTFKANRVEDEKTLSYLVYKGKHDTIKMYVTYDANLVGRVTFEIIDVSVPNNRQVVASGDVVDQEIKEQVIQSTYRVRVLSGGYLLAESEDIVYNGAPSKYGIIMTPVTLLEGDLDDNNVINGEDRTKLITVLNKNVVVEGSGFVEIAGDKIYADYNDDDRINSLDLGRLVQNIGKQYGIIKQN